MLKITPSQMEHIELANCAYVISVVARRVQVMNEVLKNLDKAKAKMSRFIKSKRRKTTMACGKGKKKGGKKGGKK